MNQPPAVPCQNLELNVRLGGDEVLHMRMNAGLDEFALHVLGKKRVLTPVHKDLQIRRNRAGDRLFSEAKTSSLRKQTM